MTHESTHSLEATHDTAHAGSDGHGGSGKYIAVFLVLCLLTCASFFTTFSWWPFHDNPRITWAFMLSVSCTKAMLVILFFMHLLWEANWKYVLTIPAAAMSIFLVGMLIPDVGMRARHYSEERQRFAVEASHHDQHDAPPTSHHKTDHSTEKTP